MLTTAGLIRQTSKAALVRRFSDPSLTAAFLARWRINFAARLYRLVNRRKSSAITGGTLRLNRFSDGFFHLGKPQRSSSGCTQAQGVISRSSVNLITRLLAHSRRWRRLGARYVCEYQGRAADPKKAFARLVKAVFPDATNKVVRHTFRHTAATWLMQRRAGKFQSADYSGMTMKTLESTYGHHHPDHQSTVNNAFSKRKTAAG